MAHHKLKLAQNIAWAYDVRIRDPDFFRRIAEGQQPDTLWIGCADSRVPAEEIIHAAPGELFVHRNIANVIRADDVNVLSVIEYAVNILKVSHIVVCGHYQCGGVIASMSAPHPEIPTVNRHLAQVRKLAERHQSELDLFPDKTERTNRLAELNVLDQVDRLAQLPVVSGASHDITLHGWIFSLQDGLLKVLHPPETTSSTRT